MNEQKDTADGGTVRHDTSTASPPINIEKLAEKVYQLMRAEARLTRARGDRRGTRR